MAYHNVRHYATIALVLVLALAATTEAGEADCKDVVSPISGTSLKGLIWRAVDLGATRDELYAVVARTRCRVYLERIIDSTKPNKEP